MLKVNIKTPDPRDPENRKRAEAVAPSAPASTASPDGRGRPAGSFGDDSIASRLSKLDVGESLAVARRLPATGKHDLRKIYDVLTSPLINSAKRVAAVQPGFDTSVERGQFKTRAGLTVLVVVMTRIQ